MDEVDRMVIGVRADCTGFERDIETMRGKMEETLGAGAERAGRSIETALMRAVRTGKFGFDELKSVALGVLADIAQAALRAGLNGLLGGGGSMLGTLTSLSGLPGRATGGPVTPGRGYIVGERGPELFVPTTSGQVEPRGIAALGGRDVRVTIQVQAGNGEAPAAMARSSRQVARAVRAALEG